MQRTGGVAPTAPRRTFALVGIFHSVTWLWLVVGAVLAITFAVAIPYLSRRLR
jgi:hypothetical protein